MKTDKKASENQKTGLVQVYLNPNGKTNFAPYGLALRASGYGLRSFIARYTHHGFEEGESAAVRSLFPNLAIDTSFLQGAKENAQADRSAAATAFQNAAQMARSGEYDLVILDGILDLVSKGLISIAEIEELIAEKATHVELILTGPDIGEEAILEKAHLVTEMVIHRETLNAQGTDVQVVTGKGKGKTTYCLGKALMMSGTGVPAFMLQIIKSPRLYGETLAVRNVTGMQIQSMGKGLVKKQNPDGDPNHRIAAREAWQVAKKLVMSGRYGLVVLDEINIAVNYGFIFPYEVVDLIQKMPEELHLILGGRYAHPEVITAASKAVEMKEVKHPYKMGIKARKGIEF